MRISSLALAMVALIPVAVAAPLSPRSGEPGSDPVMEDPHAPTPARRIAVRLTPHKLPGAKTAPTRPTKAPTPAKKVVAGKAPAKKMAVKRAPPKGASAKVAAKKVVGIPPHYPAVRRGHPVAVKGAKHPPLTKPVAAKKPLHKKPGVKAPAKVGLAKGMPAKKTGPAKMIAVKMGPPSAEQKAVQSKYDAMSLLVMRRDGNRLATLFLGMTTPDFVYRDKKGRKLNRAQLVGQLKRQMTMVKSFKRSGNKVATFALKGLTGTAGVVSDFAMIFPNGKKTVTVAGQSTTSDTWVKTVKGWKLRSIRTLRESVKYNGKPM